MIELKDLTKIFDGIVAVDSLSLSIEPGEVLGFLGPNGAGKSTTMKMLTGFLKPDAGSASIYGYDVQSDLNAIKQIIGYLPEGAPAWGEMTTAEFLRFVADIRQIAANDKQSSIDHVVAQLELGTVLHRPIDTLSKGFKRRVGIAQAIIHDPKVLILDEPTDGLDPNQKHQVRELIRSLATDKIVIISTHILEEVNAVCSRAVIISEGKLLADKTPAELELQSRYHNAITIALGDDTDVRSALTSMSEIAGVEQHAHDAHTFTVFPVNGESIYAIVSKAASENQWPVESLHVERGRLDDVFRDVTTNVSTEVAA
ncbi:MAG: ATP-binding cassette domain-containing protein [Pseudomonadota bacterium]